jgi:hypothetical protein
MSAFGRLSVHIYNSALFLGAELFLLCNDAVVSGVKVKSFISV